MSQITVLNYVQNCWFKHIIWNKRYYLFGSLLSYTVNPLEATLGFISRCVLGIKVIWLLNTHTPVQADRNGFLFLRIPLPPAEETHSSLKLNSKTETNHSGYKRRVLAHCSYRSFCMIRFAKLLQKFDGASSSISQHYRTDGVLLVTPHCPYRSTKAVSVLTVGSSPDVARAFAFWHETVSEMNTANTPPIRMLQWHSIAAPCPQSPRAIEKCNLSEQRLFGGWKNYPGT